MSKLVVTNKTWQREGGKVRRQKESTSSILAGCRVVQENWGESSGVMFIYIWIFSSNSHKNRFWASRPHVSVGVRCLNTFFKFIWNYGDCTSGKDSEWQLWRVSVLSFGLGQLLPGHRKIDHCVGGTEFVTNF